MLAGIILLTLDQGSSGVRTENFDKSFATPKVRIEISGGVSSTISSYKPQFRCYRYSREF